jgi:decaprenyl-phosphate phosphoribosyltransferase
VSFNVFLYGGIYTLNDVADRAADLRHPFKKNRPIAAGLVSVGMGTIFAAAFIAIGVGSAFLLFDTAIIACYLAVIAFNALYSLKARNLRYADVLFNSVTHPTRFLMGVLLVGRTPPASHLAALLLLAIALSCLRRDIERDVPGWQARETIGRYAPNELAVMACGCLGALGFMAASQARHAPGFYAILLTTAVVLAGGGWIARPVRSSLRAIWTH